MSHFCHYSVSQMTLKKLVWRKIPHLRLYIQNVSENFWLIVIFKGIKTTKLCSTSYIRSFVVYLQVSFTKLKESFSICEPSQVLKSGLVYTPQISLLFVRIGEIVVSNILQARAASSLSSQIKEGMLNCQVWKPPRTQTSVQFRVFKELYLRSLKTFYFQSWQFY